MTALPSPVSGPGSFKAETAPVCPHLLANPLTALSQATGLPWDSAVTYLVVVLFGEILIHMRTKYYMIHGQLELRIGGLTVNYMQIFGWAEGQLL